MRKVAVLFLSIAMIFCFAACSGGSDTIEENRVSTRERNARNLVTTDEFISRIGERMVDTETGQGLGDRHLDVTYDEATYKGKDFIEMHYDYGARNALCIVLVDETGTLDFSEITGYKLRKCRRYENIYYMYPGDLIGSGRGFTEREYDAIYDKMDEVASSYKDGTLVIDKVEIPEKDENLFSENIMQSLSRILEKYEPYLPETARLEIPDGERKLMVFSRNKIPYSFYLEPDNAANDTARDILLRLMAIDEHDTTYATSYDTRGCGYVEIVMADSFTKEQIDFIENTGSVDPEYSDFVKVKDGMYISIPAYRNTEVEQQILDEVTNLFR